MKIYNFKAKTSNLSYPVLEDSIIECTDQPYNMFMVYDALKKLSEVKSVSEFNTMFSTTEDETVSWDDFNLEFKKSSNPMYLFEVSTNNTLSYYINNITGILEHI